MWKSLFILVVAVFSTSEVANCCLKECRAMIFLKGLMTYECKLMSECMKDKIDETGATVFWNSCRMEEPN